MSVLYRRILLTHFLLVGCGGSATTPPTGDSSAPASNGPCLASLVSRSIVDIKRTSWTQVGTLQMSIAEDKPKSVTLRDAQGNVIPTDLPADADEQATRAWVITSICKVGGLFGVAEEPKGDTVTAVIYKPKSDDEGADLNELCTPPTSYLAQAPDADPAQQTMIAAAYYEGSLASPKWRSWHLDGACTNRRSVGKKEHQGKARRRARPGRQSRRQNHLLVGNDAQPLRLPDSAR